MSQIEHKDMAWDIEVIETYMPIELMELNGILAVIVI